jgi:hypothetical protein
MAIWQYCLGVFDYMHYALCIVVHSAHMSWLYVPCQRASTDVGACSLMKSSNHTSIHLPHKYAVMLFCACTTHCDDADDDEATLAQRPRKPPGRRLVGGMQAAMFGVGDLVTKRRFVMGIAGAYGALMRAGKALCWVLRDRDPRFHPPRGGHRR